MGKSSHHKTENTFKFQSFSERIANVNIDVIHRIRYNDDQPEESGTYFGEALNKWAELNCTEHFTNFRTEISAQVQTFTQLVHHEPEIVSGLQKHLQVPNSLAFEPLLDLVVQLARDLQSDFYKHFKDFFSILVGLLNGHPQDSDLLEKIFTTLSYLFKFLWRYLLKDIKNVYGIFSTLLASPYKDYIQNFAAESFSFLMRKVKKRDDLLNFLFSSLESNPEQSSGVGRLLFEMVKGVRNQFHSCINQIFPVILGKLGPVQHQQEGECPVLPWQLVQTAIGHMMMSMADYSTVEYLEEPWNFLLMELERLYEVFAKGDKSCSADAADQITRLLHLVHGWLTYHRGKIISDPDHIAMCLIRLLKGPCLPDQAGEKLLKDIAQLVLLAYSKLTMENTAKLVSLAFKTKYNSSLLHAFTKDLFDLPLFEKDVLPSLLVHCDRQIGVPEEGCHQAALSLLTELVMNKCTMPSITDDRLNTKTCMLDFSSFKTTKKKSSVPQYFIELLTSTKLTKSVSDQALGQLWSAFVCLPHVRPLDKQKAVENMQRLVTEAIKLAKSDHRKGALRSLLFQMVYALSLIHEDGELFNWIPWKTVEKLVCDYPDNVPVLQLCDLYVSMATEEGHTDILQPSVFEKLFPPLKKNLSSSQREVRLLTLRIFTRFDLPLPEVENRMSLPVSVFQICHKAESVPLGVQEYKQKLMYLRKLNFDIVQNSIPVGGYAEVPLRFLIGSLYNNFKLLWEPLCDLIASHANGLERTQFWDIYKEELVLASERTEAKTQGNTLKTDVDTFCELQGDEEELVKMFKEHIRNLVCNSTKPDAFNFRLQLWKAMQGFADKCEAKSRELVPLLMRFLQNEYYPADLSAAPTQDVTLPESQAKTTTDTDVDQEDFVSQKEKKGGGKKRAQKALVVHLEVFAKFINPKSVYMEEELRHLYYQLLLHQEEEIQKVAFSCLLTYRWKYLMPYKENFERLMDEETFREELVLFSLDEQSSPIDQGHRPQLLPILFRLLYGKMMGKAGSGSVGKGNSNLRRSLIFRFLAGCRQDELKVFLDLVFEPSKHFISDDPVKKLSEIQDSLDLTKLIPLKKIQGILNTIDILCKKLGHLLEGYLPCLLQILLGLSQVCAVCLTVREKIRPGAVNLLKMLRQLTTGQITQFFHEFESYKFSSKDVDAVFTVAVWPQLEKLPFEGVYHPTPLMKLFLAWSRHPRYICLLGKCQRSDPSCSPLPFVYALLLSKTIHHSVVSVIIEITDNLLSMPNFEPTADNTAIQVEPCVRPDCGMSETLGTQLLLPHIPALLQHIEGAVKQLALEQNKKFGQITELRILSRVSSFVKDEKQCVSLIHLLLPFLGKLSSKSQDMEADILRSILNLIKSVKDPSQFYRPISRLFSTIEPRLSRQLLSDILMVLGEKVPSLSNVAELVTQLNSWDKRRMEEPDYNIRLSAFQTINTTVKEMTKIDTDFLFPIIHNSCFFIVRVDDLSLRDNATHCMVTMVKQVAALEVDTETFRDVITQGLLVEVKAGIRHKKEAVRHEFVSLLAVLVNSFPTSPCFSDLTALTDKDPEADFFENIRHIQAHRRARALRRLIKHLQGHPMSLHFINTYFLPLTSVFLLDESYIKFNSLQDAAVDAMATLCRCLTWRQYSVQLRYYLGLLPKKLHIQKLLIRVIVAVLDAFHFDLSKSTYTIRKVPKAIEKEAVADGAELDMNADTGEIVDEQIDVVTNGQMDTQLNENEGHRIFNFKEKTVCTEEVATKIHYLILQTILPQLHKCLTEKVKSDGEHKLAKKKYAEDDEVLRVPIALAMVKLLQSLPQGSLHQNLPSILMKVCHFLKSRSKDVREISRDTLVKMSMSLGVQYFPYILKEMRSTLKRGYQLHVLSYTVHTILRNLSSQLTPGALDPCLTSLLEVFNEEVFGQVAEEKDVEGIVGKLMEAKSSKSYDSYELIGRLVGQNSLTLLIQPLKQILDTSRNHKTSKKAQDILQRVSKGFLENPGLTEENVLVFIHGLTSETLPVLFCDKQTDKKKVLEEQKPGERPPSCLLLTTAAPRGGVKPKGSQRTNVHILVEFGLQLLHLLLKKSRLVPSNLANLQMLDPFISVLADCLTSKHVKMTCVSLRCLCWLLKFPLPSLETQVERIASSLFVLLKNYATAGAAKGDNKELVSMCFKTVTVLVRDVKLYKLGTDQLKVLLSFCEEDIHDFNRQGTAFTLLKAILSRKVVLPEVHELMLKVEKMALTGDSPHVRLQSRQLTLQYLIDYPLGNKLQKHLEFFVTQLEYEMESGRESTLEMLATIFSSFPQNVLIKFSGLFFFPMATSLANDESAKCKKLTALALKSLLEKIDLNTRNELFAVTLKWFRDNKVRHRILGAQLCGLFVEVESAKFENHLEEVLPVLQEQIDPDRYKQEGVTQGEEQELDQLLFNCLNSLMKILRECNVLRNPKWTLHFSVIWDHIRHHLTYDHMWVRYVSCQLIGLLFSAWSPDELVSAVTTPQETEEYLLNNTLSKLSTLATDLCSQLQSTLLDQDLAEQVIKNMVFITRTAKLITSTVKQKTEKDEIEDTDESSVKGDKSSVLSLRWLVKKMVREANHETINQPKVTIKRKNVFKWLAAVSLDLGEPILSGILPLMLPPLIRESSEKTNSTDTALKSLALEVLELIKGIVGVEIFTQLYTKVQRVLQERRISRKRQRAEEAVTNPEMAAKRKLKKNLSKKEAKKRRIEQFRPAKKVKKRKL
ncbi:small subunit processome component 20 homolog [Liolophura sinensis]|uniref:small subunit processome component 20 homolog n=1 Tax=Liolophura sinensis TaxID=3198878 RepID=UPI0031582464